MLRGRLASFLAVPSTQCVGPLVLSNTAGFSFLIRLCVACDVPNGEPDLVTVSSGSSQRLVFHGLVVHSMYLALALTISLHAFREFVQRLCTCQQPLSVGFVPLEAVCIVICSASARLNGTDVLVYRSTSCHRAYHESRACLQKRCFAVYGVRGKGETVFSCFCCV